jgi:hypothetical protein
MNHPVAPILQRQLFSYFAPRRPGLMPGDIDVAARNCQNTRAKMVMQNRRYQLVANVNRRSD